MSKWTEFRDDMIGRMRERADGSWGDLEAKLRETGDPTIIALLDRHLGSDDALQEALRRAEATPRGRAVRGALEHVGRNFAGYAVGGAGLTGALTLPALLSWQSIPMLLLLLAGGASIVRNRQDSSVRNRQEAK